MFLFNGFKIRNLIIVELYYILKSIKAGEFIDIKKLSSCDDFFVILDTGLYLYDFNIDNCNLIYKFNNNEIKSKEINNINITELYNEKNAYIFCLVNEYLFIFDEYTYQLFNCTINEINDFNDGYYNLMPYKIENNISNFIIAFNNETNKLYFYFYNFDINEGINEQKLIQFNNMNITNKIIRCDINSNTTFIICFYYSKNNSQNNNNEQKIVGKTFIINNTELIQENTDVIFNKEFSGEINQIQIAKSYNDKFFICFLENKRPECFVNDNPNEFFNFKEIKCKPGENEWSDKYKVLYFNESNNFMLISRHLLTATILNNDNNSIIKCKQNIFSMQENTYSIIYNNGFKLVNYTNFSEHNKCLDIKYSKYEKEIKEYIKNTDVFNENKLIENLNELIKNWININYLDENKELIVQKNEMIIGFTSTYIQKMKENKNSSTINLGKCEDTLKYIYNISNQSNLYMLKIDREQKGKNYPLIEYEVFYPLNNGKMEILNLSYCEGADIELSLPIIINDTINKYNPKSNYYNDICTKAASDFNTDIPLNDRRNEFIKNNMSLCEENCEFTEYDNIYKKVKCSCKIKTALSLDNNESDNKNILKNFIDIKKITNIEIIKCYRNCYKINVIKNNYGFFIFIFIFIIYFICIVVFYLKSLKNLIDEIIKIITAINNKKYQITAGGKAHPFPNNNQKIKKKNLVKNKVESEFSTKGKILTLKNNNNKNVNGKNKKTIKKNKNKNLNIDIKDKKKEIDKNYTLEYSESELNFLSYKIALKKDKRTYCQYYWSLLKKKHIILFSFYPNKDYNSQIIKIFLFFLFCLQMIQCIKYILILVHLILFINYHK